MENKLLPCPKCNGKADLNEGSYVFDGGGRYYAFSAEFECLECGLLFKVHNDYPIKYVEHDAMWDFAIEAWNTRHERTCDGCKHLATSMRVDYHIDPCCECVRNAPDLYEPKEETDAD